MTPSASGMLVINKPPKVRAVLYVWGGLAVHSYRPMPGWWRRFWTWALLGWEWEPVKDGDDENLG